MNCNNNDKLKCMPIYYTCFGPTGATGPTGPTGPTPVLSGMQLQLTAEIVTVPNDGNVIFDTIVSSLSPVISYNSVSGEITITENGIYYINWWIGADGSTVAPFILFSIVVSDGTEISSATPIQSDNMSGNALLNITTAPVTLSLVNKTGNDVFLGGLVKADITIIH